MQITDKQTRKKQKIEKAKTPRSFANFTKRKNPEKKVFDPPCNEGNVNRKPQTYGLDPGTSPIAWKRGEGSKNLGQLEAAFLKFPTSPRDGGEPWTTYGWGWGTLVHPHPELRQGSTWK